jgi:hypothetical protein
MLHVLVMEAVHHVKMTDAPTFLPLFCLLILTLLGLFVFRYSYSNTIRMRYLVIYHTAVLPAA